MANSVEGLICIDKPAGQTSHDVVNVIRRLSGIRRVGHSGTLDPLATGLMLVCVGRATRLLEYLVGQSKTYLATVLLGQETDTFDAEGQIVAERPVQVSPEQLSAALTDFRGTINQLAPLYSAVKVDGQPLYRRARRGETVARPARTVTIYELVLLNRQESILELRINCSSGTYVRSLAHDLGQSLGCGAYLAALRRTVIGSFSLEDAQPLTELNRQDWWRHLRPSDSAVEHLARLDVSDREAQALYYGQTIDCKPGQTKGPLARAYDEQGHFVGVVGVDETTWRAKKIFYQLDQG